MLKGDADVHDGDAEVLRHGFVDDDGHRTSRRHFHQSFLDNIVVSRSPHGMNGVVLQYMRNRF